MSATASTLCYFDHLRLFDFRIGTSNQSSTLRLLIKVESLVLDIGAEEHQLGLPLAQGLAMPIELKDLDGIEGGMLLLLLLC
jgi:hypothetical protein